MQAQVNCSWATSLRPECIRPAHNCITGRYGTHLLCTRLAAAMHGTWPSASCRRHALSRSSPPSSCWVQEHDAGQ